MAELKLNRLKINVLIKEFDIYLSDIEFEGSIKRRNDLRDRVIKEFFSPNITDFYYSFIPNQKANKVSLSVLENKYFIKPYINHVLKKYFETQGFLCYKDFVNDLEIWDKKGIDGKYVEFEKFGIKINTLNTDSSYEIILSYEGVAVAHTTSLAKLGLHSPISKVIYAPTPENKKIFRLEDLGSLDLEKVYPILNNKNKQELGLQFVSTFGKNTYREYYIKINDFYGKNLSGRVIDEKIHISQGGFESISNTQIFSVKNINNQLEFFGGKDFNVLAGLKKYGPFKTVENNIFKFIFIIKNNSNHKNSANTLFKYLTKGYESFFPSMKQFLRINFEIDTVNSIRLEEEDVVNELSRKINELPKGDYFAFYLTDYDKSDHDENHESEYYSIKHLLISNNILSQFICYNNITKDAFKYHLPNIAVAVLAKIGGIPWKLDVQSKGSLVVGFGVKRTGKEVYLGNTLCFNDEGEFFAFESYEKDSLDNLIEGLKSSIKAFLRKNKSQDFKRLVIHYYKNLKKKEAEKIERLLKEFDLEIPYIVLTINETNSKDDVFFDVSSADIGASIIMPVSGTIVEIKKQQEYLMTNNTRYSESSSYRIQKYPFPLKIKVNNNPRYQIEVLEVKDLLDQVYAFSRIYWKSISQVSLPVTIVYSKIVADLSSHFPDHTLPKNSIAHSTPWFL